MLTYLHRAPNRYRDNADFTWLKTALAELGPCWTLGLYEPSSSYLVSIRQLV